MEKSIETDPWLILEEELNSDRQLASDNVFWLGNGKVGQSGNFEEFFSGDSKPCTYLSGIYKSKTTVDQNNTDQLSNLPNWTSLNIRLNTELLDLSKCEIIFYKRSLDLKKGYLERTFEVKTQENNHIQVSFQRFLSLKQKEIGAIKVFIRSIDFNGRILFTPVIDGDFNYVEPEWNVLQSKTQKEVAHLWIQTRKTNFQVCMAVTFDLYKNNALVKVNPTKIEKTNVAGFSFGTDLKSGESACVHKFVSMLSSLDHPYNELTIRACELAITAKNTGWSNLFEENSTAWEQNWEKIDSSLSKNEILTEFQQYRPK